jgi:hypothetical protein
LGAVWILFERFLFSFVSQNCFWGLRTSHTLLKMLTIGLNLIKTFPLLNMDLVVQFYAIDHKLMIIVDSDKK